MHSSSSMFHSVLEGEDAFEHTLVVTNGPFAGRICEAQDEQFLPSLEAKQTEEVWFFEYEANERTIDTETGYEFDPELDVGFDCIIVTFGYHMEYRATHLIPREFLRVATTNDLVLRHEEISQQIVNEAWSESRVPDNSETILLLKERSFILSELWMRERNVLKRPGRRKVFLCHSSLDKPIVKRLWLDLGHAGHKPWLDEFEIGVGDSIVAKIDSATTCADAVVLFLSKNSAKSDWVKREWHSTLARQLSKKKIALLPAVIDECEIPALLADIKFADFRKDYDFGLGSLLQSLSKIKKNTSKRNSQ